MTAHGTGRASSNVLLILLYTPRNTSTSLLHLAHCLLLERQRLLEHQCLLPRALQCHFLREPQRRLLKRQRLATFPALLVFVFQDPRIRPGHQKGGYRLCEDGLGGPHGLGHFVARSSNKSQMLVDM